jgi:hypothetical protein
MELGTWNIGTWKKELGFVGPWRPAPPASDLKMRKKYEYTIDCDCFK